MKRPGRVSTPGRDFQEMAGCRPPRGVSKRKRLSGRKAGRLLIT